MVFGLAVTLFKFLNTQMRGYDNPFRQISKVKRRSTNLYYGYLTLLDINGISGMTQLLKAYGDKLSPEKKAEILAGLQRNVTKMTDLLDDVLTISRQDLGKLQFNPAPLDLADFSRHLLPNI